MIRVKNFSVEVFLVLLFYVMYKVYMFDIISAYYIIWLVVDVDNYMYISCYHRRCDVAMTTSIFTLL